MANNYSMIEKVAIIKKLQKKTNIKNNEAIPTCSNYVRTH